MHHFFSTTESTVPPVIPPWYGVISLIVIRYGASLRYLSNEQFRRFFETYKYFSNWSVLYICIFLLFRFPGPIGQLTLCTIVGWLCCVLLLPDRWRASSLALMEWVERSLPWPSSLWSPPSSYYELFFPPALLSFWLIPPWFISLEMLWFELFLKIERLFLNTLVLDLFLVGQPSHWRELWTHGPATDIKDSLLVNYVVVSSILAAALFTVFFSRKPAREKEFFDKRKRRVGPSVSAFF